MTRSDEPGRGSQRSSGPAARRIARLLVGAAVLAAIAVLVAAAVRQTQQVAETGLLAAPTPPPMPASLPARTLPVNAARRIGQEPPPSTLPSLSPQAAAPHQIPSMVAPPATAQGVPPPQSAGSPAAPPRPTPTPELVASLTCRRGMTFDVEPASTLVTINGEPVGEVSQWDDEDEPLMLRRPGVYYVRLSCAGCPTRWFKVTVDPSAEDKLVEIRSRTDD